MLSQQARQEYRPNIAEGFHKHYLAHYAGSGTDYEALQPAYEYGCSMANDPVYKGRSWDDVTPTLKSNYIRRSPTTTWEKVKEAIRYGWEKTTGKSKSL